jgi:soluble lytic murein transglycosylase-like protein
MQLMDGTARELGVTDSFDPAQNIAAGARYLKQMLNRFGGDVTRAVAAYNAGPGSVEASGGVPPFAETQSYVKNVLRTARSR